MDIPQQAWKWRKQTWIVLIAGLVAILIALVASYAFAMFRPTTDVRIGQGGVYSLWIASTDAELYQGLSGVERLPGNGGLLMDFKVSGTHGIVMRGMLVPIDIVWLDESKKVVYAVKEAPPHLGESKVYTPTTPARYVLELPAGSVKRSAIKIGDTAYFELNGNGL